MKYPETGHYQWIRGNKHRWNTGEILAYYECTSDFEGENFYGPITKVELDEDEDDWLYTFEDEYQEYESQLVENKAYAVSKTYYEKHQ